MPAAEKDVRFCHKQFRELQLLRTHQLPQHCLVKRVEVQDADLAFHLGDILQNLVGLCFPQAEIIVFSAARPNQRHKGIDGKGIMLGGNAELLLLPRVRQILFLDERRLFQHLPGIAQKDLALLGNRNATVSAGENGNAHLLFQLFQRLGQAWLCQIQGGCRLADGLFFLRPNGVPQLL